MLYGRLGEQERVRALLDAARDRRSGAQLFLSPRTVDFRLRNVFAKLGISSRTELAALRLDTHGS